MMFMVVKVQSLMRKRWLLVSRAPFFARPEVSSERRVSRTALPVLSRHSHSEYAMCGNQNPLLKVAYKVASRPLRFEPVTLAPMSATKPNASVRAPKRSVM